MQSTHVQRVSTAVLRRTLASQKKGVATLAAFKIPKVTNEPNVSEPPFFGVFGLCANFCANNSNTMPRAASSGRLCRPLLRSSAASSRSRCP